MDIKTGELMIFTAWNFMMAGGTIFVIMVAMNIIVAVGSKNDKNQYPQ